MTLPGLEGTSSAADALPTKYFLAVDGGGSSCTAVLLSSAEAVSIGEAGSCNVTTMGIEAALSVISSAVCSALARHEDVAAGRIVEVPISAAWVALAGYDRPHLAAILVSAISKLLGIPAGPRLIVSSDIDLLSVKAASERSVQMAIVLVAGTGSVAMSFERSDGSFKRTARAGGWGSLLGDDGSGFAIGKAALRAALRSSDMLRNKAGVGKGLDGPPPAISRLSEAVFSHFSASQKAFNPQDLLTNILAPEIPVSPSSMAAPESGASSATRRIARTAQAVLELAESDDEAKAILQEEAASLADMVSDLVRDKGVDPRGTALVTAGGVLRNKLYNGMVQRELSGRGHEFKCVMNVEVPALEGARWLATHRNPMEKNEQ